MIKTLVLVRHAHALSSFAAQVQTDDKRPLSPEGQDKAAFTARRLKKLNIAPARILTSPLLRARQTAEILAAQLAAPLAEVTQLDGLHTDTAVRNFLCEQLQMEDTLLAVGHNPNISYVTHLLCGQIYAFLPGSFALLRIENNQVLPSVIFGE